jgi:hypothetical protein
MKVTHRLAGLLFALALGAGWLAAAGPAFAQPARIVVVPFQGMAGERVREAVINRLIADGYEVVSMAEIRRAVSEVGRQFGPGDRWQVVSSRLGLAAVIKGQVTGGNRWQAIIEVDHAQSSIPAGSVTVSALRPVGLVRAVSRTSWPRVVALLRQTLPGGALAPRRSAVANAPGAALEQSTAPAEAGAGADETDEGSGAPEIAVRRGKSLPPALLEASVGPRAISRTLTFSDNVSALPAYRLPGAPGLAGEVSFYPGARSASWLSNVGFTGAFETSVGATTQSRPGAAETPTRHLAYRVGMRARVPSTIATLLLGADYGEQDFALQVPDRLSVESHYTFIRPNLAARLAFGRGSFVLSAGYLQLLETAGLTASGLFPKATVSGTDVGLTMGYALDRSLQVQLGADYRRYAYTMNTQETDALRVGGAIDAYAGLTALITYRFR